MQNSKCRYSFCPGAVPHAVCILHYAFCITRSRAYFLPVVARTCNREVREGVMQNAEFKMQIQLLSRRSAPRRLHSALCILHYKVASLLVTRLGAHLQSRGERRRNAKCRIQNADTASVQAQCPTPSAFCIMHSALQGREPTCYPSWRAPAIAR